MFLAILISFLFPLAAGLGLEHMLYGNHDFGGWLLKGAALLFIGLLGCHLFSVRVCGNDGYDVINPAGWVGGGTTAFLSFMNIVWGDHRLLWILFLVVMSIIGLALVLGMDRYGEATQRQRGTRVVSH